MDTTSSYEAPAVEREIAPGDLNRESYYAGGVLSQLAD